jgi:hypothetical protein
LGKKQARFMNNLYMILIRYLGKDFVNIIPELFSVLLLVSLLFVISEPTQDFKQTLSSLMHEIIDKTNHLGRGLRLLLMNNWPKLREDLATSL